MKNKRCLGFLVITLVLVVSMFSNVFASNGKDWTCIYSNNTKYAVGDIVKRVSGLNISSDGSHTEECQFESNFEVESGDELSLSFGASFWGDKSKFDGSASICIASIYAENGTKLLEVRFELNGNQIEKYGHGLIYVSDEDAGKLTFDITMENTGTNEVKTNIEELYVEVNGDEI